MLELLSLDIENFGGISHYSYRQVYNSSDVSYSDLEKCIRKFFSSFSRYQLQEMPLSGQSGCLKLRFRLKKVLDDEEHGPLIKRLSNQVITIDACVVGKSTVIHKSLSLGEDEGIWGELLTQQLDRVLSQVEEKLRLDAFSPAYNHGYHALERDRSIESHLAGYRAMAGIKNDASKRREADLYYGPLFEKFLSEIGESTTRVSEGDIRNIGRILTLPIKDTFNKALYTLAHLSASYKTDESFSLACLETLLKTLSEKKDSGDCYSLCSESVLYSITDIILTNIVKMRQLGSRMSQVCAKLIVLLMCIAARMHSRLVPRAEWLSMIETNMQSIKDFSQNKAVDTNLLGFIDAVKDHYKGKDGRLWTYCDRAGGERGRHSWGDTVLNSIDKGAPSQLLEVYISILHNYRRHFHRLFNRRQRLAPLFSTYSISIHFPKKSNEYVMINSGEKYYASVPERSTLYSVENLVVARNSDSLLVLKDRENVERGVFIAPPEAADKCVGKSIFELEELREFSLVTLEPNLFEIRPGSRKVLVSTSIAFGDFSFAQSIVYRWLLGEFYNDKFRFLFHLDLEEMDFIQEPLMNVFIRYSLDQEYNRKAGIVVKDVQDVVEYYSDGVLFLIDGYEDSLRKDRDFIESLLELTESYVIVTSTSPIKYKRLKNYDFGARIHPPSADKLGEFFSADLATMDVLKNPFYMGIYHSMHKEGAATKAALIDEYISRAYTGGSDSSYSDDLVGLSKHCFLSLFRWTDGIHADSADVDLFERFDEIFYKKIGRVYFLHHHISLYLAARYFVSCRIYSEEFHKKLVKWLLKRCPSKFEIFQEFLSERSRGNISEFGNIPARHRVGFREVFHLIVKYHNHSGSILAGRWIRMFLDKAPDRDTRLLVVEYLSQIWGEKPSKYVKLLFDLAMRDSDSAVRGKVFDLLFRAGDSQPELVRTISRGLDSARRPLAAPFFYLLGYKAFTRSSYVFAIACIREGLSQVESEDRVFASKYHNLLGNCYFSTGDYSKAISEFEKALRHCDGKDPNSHLVLANILFNMSVSKQRLKLHEEAEEHVLEAIKHNPNDSDYWNQLGEVLFHQRMYATSYKAFKKAWALRKQFKVSFNLFKSVMFMLDETEGERDARFAEAEEYANAMYSLMPRPQILVYHMLLYLTYKPRSMTAVAALYEKFSGHESLSKAGSVAGFLRGMSLVLSKKWADAIEHFRESASHQDPAKYSVFSRMMLGYCQDRVGRREKARANYKMVSRRESIAMLWYRRAVTMENNRNKNHVSVKRRMPKLIRNALSDANDMFPQSIQFIAIDPDEYQIEKHVGSGGFKKVYKAKWFGVDAAILKFRGGVKIDNFVSEMSLMCSLSHPNLLTLYGVTMIDNKTPGFVTEFCPNGDLYQLLYGDREISMERRLRISIDISRALSYTHKRGVSHRDLKSQNVLFDKDWNAKLTDFGLAKRDSESLLESNVGTSYWKAPEMLLGKDYDGRKADVYSFGLIMFELMTRTIPYKEIDEYRLKKKIAKDGYRPAMSKENNPLYALITQCWDPDPLKRPEMEGVLLRLETILEEYNERARRLGIRDH